MTGEEPIPDHAPQELAKKHRVDAQTVVRWFEDEPSVLISGSTETSLQATSVDGGLSGFQIMSINVGSSSTR